MRKIIYVPIVLLLLIIAFVAVNMYINRPVLGHNVITVAKDDSGEFTTISEAVAMACSGDTIYVGEGIYDELVVLDDANISLIGADKEKCIIRNTTGVYKNAPIFACGDFLIANLSVEMTLDGVGEWEPTYEDNVADTYPGYAIHIDAVNKNKERSVHRGEIINCKFYSEAFPAAGIGINNNQIVEFVNCEFIRNAEDDIYHKDKWRGAFVAHASNLEAKNEYLNLLNCTFISNYGDAANFLMTLTGEKEAVITAINNSFWSEELQSSNCIEYLKGESKLSEESHGNTADCLNAR